MSTRLDFNETYLVNYLLTKPSKRGFINKLKWLLENKEIESELQRSIESLIDKFEDLSENQVRIVYEDRVAGKIATLPQYVIK